MAHRVARSDRRRFFVDADTHPQTIAVLATRAEPIGLQLEVGPLDALDPATCFGALISHPGSTGAIRDIGPVIQAIRETGGISVVTTDLLACVLITPPGELGADIVVGSAQRFGVPMGFGGPHAGFLAVREAHAPRPARPARRREHRHCRPAGHAARAADPRTAHPPGEGDIEHLHRAGAARQHRWPLRGVPRPRRARAHRESGPSPDIGARRGAPAGRGDPARRRHLVRHAGARSRRRGGRGLGTGPRSRGQPPADRRHPRRHQSRRDLDGGRGRSRVEGVRCRRPDRCLARSRGRRWHSGMGRARERVPDPIGVPPLPHRARDAPVPAPPRRSRPRPRPHHDPPRFVHDEAQRDVGDGADHLAGVRGLASLRAGRPGSRLWPADPLARTDARDDHRLRRGEPPTQRRKSRGVRRAARHPCLPPQPRRSPAHRLSHSLVRPRHQRRERRDGRPDGHRGGVRRAGQRRCRRSQSEGGRRR